MTEVSREVATTHVEPGAGLVARMGNVVVWAEPEPGPTGRQSFDVLLTGMEDIGSQVLPRDEAATQAAALLADARVTALPGVAAVVPTASGLMALAQGWGSVVAREDGGAGTEAPAATVQMIELTDEVVVLGRQDATGRLAAAGPEAPAADDRTAPTSLGLVHGVVPGGGALVGTRITIASRAEDMADHRATDHRPGAARAAGGPVDGGRPGAGGPGGTDARAGPDRPPGFAGHPGEPAGPADGPDPSAPAGPGVPGTPTSRLAVTDEVPATGAPGAGDGPGPDGAGADRPEADVDLVPMWGPHAPPVQPRAPLPVASATAEPSTEVEPNGHGVRIEGIRCVRGHLNDPIAIHCGTCGISMIKRSSSRVVGIRPPLGIMVFDDGSIVALTRDLILGTAPDRADAVTRGSAQGLALADPAEQIEPLHAEVRLEGWEVSLIDWSNRGTYILPEEATSWQVAPRGVPVTLTPGTRIALGHRIVVFDSNTRAR